MKNRSRSNYTFALIALLLGTSATTQAKSFSEYASEFWGGLKKEVAKEFKKLNEKFEYKAQDTGIQIGHHIGAQLAKNKQVKQVANNKVGMALLGLAKDKAQGQLKKK